MRVDEFDYDLPEALIALHPADRRDASRMLVVDRAAGAIRHGAFADLPESLRAGDLLVLNDTKVLPARLFGRRATGGRVEFLLTEKLDGPRDGRETWRVLVGSSKRLRAGETVALDAGIQARIAAVEGDGCFRVDLPAGVESILDDRGHVPLPPYIAARREEVPEDRARYQTVYAERPGSCAAPTAGLHFTPEVFFALARRGIGVARLTLHVGPGTFLPVRVDEVERHRMHEEAFEIPDETARAVVETRRRGGRVVACGTTSARTLETWAAAGTTRGRTDLFIFPGFRFRVVDALLTNFHLPRSTLLMLVASLAGTDLWRRAYDAAVRERYRFYSYGDCMLVL